MIKIFKLPNYQARNFPIPSSIWRNPLHFIAFGFGSGAIPVAPGTFGTLFAIPFYLILQPLSLTYYLTLTATIIILSVWLSHKISKELGFHDHPGMCLDEFCGFLVTMIHAPSGWVWVLLGFCLFRFFDILKPWPIHYLDEHLPGGFGIVLDDVLAGLISMCLLQLASYMMRLF